MQPTAAELPKPSPLRDEGDPIAMGEDGEPDTTRETGCVTFQWTTITPSWKREVVAWDGNARTLHYEGHLRRFDAQGRVRDFGEGGVHIEYDAAGNPTFRGETPPKTDTAYRYRNKYDAQHRLTRVDVAYQAVGGKPSAYEVYREFRYDEAGRLASIGIQVQPKQPLTAAALAYDTRGRVVRIDWTGEGTGQVDTFTWDDQNRLVTYERDGLIVPGGRPRDGRIEWRQQFRYDDTGRLRRVEGVDLHDPTQSHRDVTLFSPACADVGRLLPDFLLYPYLPLPAAAVPSWGG